MNLHTHDPREYIRGIHQILISKEKRIGFLFGAGSSCKTGVDSVSVPTIADMTAQIVAGIKTHSTELATAVEEIRGEIGDAMFNVESLLSSIEAKRAVIGNGTLNGLTSDSFSKLGDLVKKHVVKIVSVHATLQHEDKSKLAHSKLSKWISNVRRRYPTEIFTTNYDYLFEIALENAGEPYFDGFSGSYEPFFCHEAVEDIEAYPHLVKLWKMHGSLGWVLHKGDGSGENDNPVIRDKTAPAELMLIYPSHLKYNISKKQPYVGLIDRLCTFLQQDDAVLITCGYSFGDKHINERIATSLRRGGNSHVIAMYYDKHGEKDKPLYRLADEKDKVRDMAEKKTSGKMSVYGFRHAIIGGQFGEWKLRDEPKENDLIRVSQYFDEDGTIPKEEAGEHKGGGGWEGTGEFILPDFRELAEFLADLSVSETSSHTVKTA